MTSWLLLGISLLGIGPSFVYLNKMTSRMKQGDGPGVIQNCRRLAWSWSAMVLGLNGSDLAGRLENNPQASFFDEFWLQGLRAAPAALVGALVCLIFWKKGKKLY